MRDKSNILTRKRLLTILLMMEIGITSSTYLEPRHPPSVLLQHSLRTALVQASGLCSGGPVAGLWYGGGLWYGAGLWSDIMIINLISLPRGTGIST